MTPEMTALTKELIAANADIRVSFGYTASHDRFSPEQWQDWRFFTKTHDGKSQYCDSRSSQLVATQVFVNDLEGVRAAAEKFFARIRAEIAEGKRFVFPKQKGEFF